MRARCREGKGGLSWNVTSDHPGLGGYLIWEIGVGKEISSQILPSHNEENHRYDSKISFSYCEAYIWKSRVIATFCQQGHHQLSGKSDENKSFWLNQSAPSIYIMIELCYFSLDQWEIRIHLLWGKCFNIPHHCDPHSNQTKFNDLLSLTIDGILTRNPSTTTSLFVILKVY